VSYWDGLNQSKTAESALEQVLIARYSYPGEVPTPFPLRSDNGLVFSSRSCTALIKSYGLPQEFITPSNPEQNRMRERVLRTLKDQCVHRQCYETLQRASRFIGDWIGFYNHQWPTGSAGQESLLRFRRLACAEPAGSIPRL
jgi:putative transposase